MRKKVCLAICLSLLVLFALNFIQTVHADESQESRVAIVFNSTQQKDQFIDSLDNNLNVATTTTVDANDSLNNSSNNLITNNANTINAIDINNSTKNTNNDNPTTIDATIDSTNIADNFNGLPVVTLDVTPQEEATIKAIAPNATIDQIGTKHLLLQNSVPLINATIVWNTTATIDSVTKINLTGKGQTACVIDTGILASHPDFAGKLIVQQCFCSAEPGADPRSSNCCPNGQSQDTSAPDSVGHGTHVAGIIAANGAIKGVAPDASIVAVKVFGLDNSNATVAYDDDIIRAISYCTTNAAQYNISVISMSLGGGATTQLCPADALAPSIEAALTANISVVVATGNDGFVNAVASPACVPGVTRVASTNKSDAISSFSDTNDNLSVPILLAPGENINSTYNNGGHAVLSGTSMATPHVSGAILLLRQALAFANNNSNNNNSQTPLTPAQIQTALNSSGQIIFSAPRVLLFSRINVFAALKNIAHLLTPNILSSNTTHPRIGGTMNVQINASPILSIANIAQVIIQQVNASYNATTGLWNATLQNDQNVTLSIVAIDSYNATRNTTINTFFDNIAPQTQLILALQNGTIIANTSSINTNNGTSSINSSNTWYNQSITITANATDNNNTVAITQISLGYQYAFTDWMNLTPNSNSANITVNQTTDDGFISYRSIDSVGNIESSRRLTIHIDKTPPAIIPRLTPPAIVRPNESLPISVIVTDDESGVAQVQALFDQQNITLVNLTRTIGNRYDGTIIAPSAASTYQLVFEATDNAGNNNASTQAAPAPTDVQTNTAVSAPRVQNNSQINNQTTLTWDILGQTGGNVSVNGVIIQNITHETTIALTSAQLQNLTNGSNSSVIFVQINLSNANGSASMLGFNYTIDTTPPALQVPILDQVNGTLQLLVNATDVSGIDTVNLSTNCAGLGQEQNQTDTSYPYLFTIDTLDCTDGLQTIVVSANDTNGLVATQNMTINVTNLQIATVPVQDSIATFEQTPFTQYIRQIVGLNSTSTSLLLQKSATTNETFVVSATNQTEILIIDINATTDNASSIAISVPASDVINASYLRYWINHSSNTTITGPFTPSDVALVGTQYDMTLTTTNFSTFILAQTYPQCTVGNAIPNSADSCLCNNQITSQGYCCSSGPSATSCPAPPSSGGGGGGGSSGGGSHSGSSGGGGGFSGAPFAAPTNNTTTNTTNETKSVNATNATMTNNSSSLNGTVQIPPIVFNLTSNANSSSNTTNHNESAPTSHGLAPTTIIEICVGLICGIVIGIWILKK